MMVMICRITPWREKQSPKFQVTTPFNQVLESAHCKHIFMLVKGRSLKTPFHPFQALFEDVNPLIKCSFCKIQSNLIQFNISLS